jgi:hypothetical protein
LTVRSASSRPVGASTAPTVISLASGEGLLILATGGEVVALEPGGTRGCDYYGVSIPGYHGTGSAVEEWSCTNVTSSVCPAPRAA